MNIVLAIFLGSYILGRVSRILEASNSGHYREGVQLWIVCWNLGMMIFSVVLLVLIFAK
jgi:hypothetical protein